MRDQMHAMRSDLEQKLTAMRAEFEVKMSGRKGTGHWGTGSIETLLEKNVTIEKKIQDIEKDMNDVKDIKEVTLNIHMIDDIKKLKESLNKGLSELSSAIETVRQNTEDDITEIKKNDGMKNKVNEISIRMSNNHRETNDHNVYLKSLIMNNDDKIDDKFQDQLEKLKNCKEKCECDYVKKENLWEFKNDIMKDINRMNDDTKEKQ